MAKVRVKPVLFTRRASISRRSTRTQKLWKVDSSGLASDVPQDAIHVLAISLAALLVKVTARIESGATPRSSIR